MRGELLVLLVLGGTLACAPRPTATPTFPDAPVVLISIDTLRADHLPAYGYRGVATPAIDALRRDGVLFENAWAHAPLTLPSHVSLFTGLLPPAHGVRDNLGYTTLVAEGATLPGLLKARGYATGASVSAYVLHGSTGLGRGFDFYEDQIPTVAAGQSIAEVQRPGEKTAALALDWLRGVPFRPFFLFLHLYEPHSPYTPPEAMRGRAALAYDGEIAAADAVVGKVLDELRRAGLYDRSLVVLLSDHGEGLGDHGEEFHGILLYREALQVPLIVKLPGAVRAGESVATPAGLVDVLPSVAALLGVAAPAGLPGRSLFGREDKAAPAIYAETFYPRLHLGWSELRSIVDDRFHYVDGPRPELFDLVRDPRERTNLLATDPRRAAALRHALDAVAGAFNAPAAVPPEQAERLAALGYLAGTVPDRGGRRPDPRERLHVLEDMKTAFRLSADGKDEEAVRALRLILAGNPGLFDVQYELAQALARLGRYEEAYDAFRASLESAPSLAGPIGLALSRVCLALKRYDEAAEHARLGLHTNPAQAHELLARAALGRGRLAEAESEALLAAGDPVAEAGGAAVRAEVRLRQERPAEALRILDDLTAKSEGRFRDVEFLRGDSLARLGRYRDAESAFRREIAAFPDNSAAYARLAIVCALRGSRVREVEGVLEEMLKARPQPEVALLAARTLDSIGDRSGAAAWRRRAGIALP